MPATLQRAADGTAWASGVSVNPSNNANRRNDRRLGRGPLQAPHVQPPSLPGHEPGHIGGRPAIDVTADLSHERAERPLVVLGRFRLESSFNEQEPAISHHKRIDFGLDAGVLVCSTARRAHPTAR